MNIYYQENIQKNEALFEKSINLQLILRQTTGPLNGQLLYQKQEFNFQNLMFIQKIPKIASHAMHLSFEAVRKKLRKCQ